MIENRDLTFTLVDETTILNGTEYIETFNISIFDIPDYCNIFTRQCDNCAAGQEPTLGPVPNCTIPVEVNVIDVVCDRQDDALCEVFLLLFFNYFWKFSLVILEH